jgi:hypothetical protein
VGKEGDFVLLEWLDPFIVTPSISSLKSENI